MLGGIDVPQSFMVLEALHRQSSGHRRELEQATRCGCFYCQRVFHPSEIQIWCDSETTALCPHCGIDSVVPETINQQLTADLMREMHTYWFERSVKVHVRPNVFQKLAQWSYPLRRRISWVLRGKH